MTAQKFIFFLLIPGVLVGFFTLLMMMGPKSIDYEQLEVENLSSELADVLTNRSLELEATFEDSLLLDELTKNDFKLLEEAITFQVEYINTLPYYSKEAEDRLQYLRERYDQLISQAYYENSLVKEKEGKALLEQEAYQKAQVLFVEAMNNQRIINERFPLSSHNNLNRLAQLNRQVKYLEAYPTYQKVVDLITKADMLVESEQWEEAAELIQEAIRLQSTLNSEYRNSNLSDSSRLFNLKKRLIDLKSERTYRSRLKLERQADQLALEGAYLEAATIYKKANALQRVINEEYPTSHHASEEEVQNLMRREQTAESYFLAEDIKAMNLAVQKHLKKRKISAAKENILKINNLILRMKEAFPKSSYYDNQIDVKINYLTAILKDLEIIQNRIYERLLPIPGTSIQMSKIEVHQALYTKIIGANPSRSSGEWMPVESISWIEANIFCERLTWILGYTVRLPKENEYRQALGNLKDSDLQNLVISSASTDGLSEVGKKEAMRTGYFDLLGNVSEWLYSEEAISNEEVQHIGGHFADNNRILFSVPLRTANKNERSRLIGFRFVVEL